MSDRVAIIGGSTSGRDHFPFAITDSGSSLPIQTFPFGLSLADFASLFYKVKTWRTEITVSWTGVGPIGYTGGVTVVWRPIVFPQFPSELGPYEPTRESDLVLPRGLDWSWDHDEGYSSDGPVIISADFTGDDFSGYAIEVDYNNNAHFFDDLFWPQVVISVFSADGNRANTWEAALTRHVGDFTFLGTETVPLNAAALSGGLGITDCEVIMTVEDYWPYATTTGEPVYDTSTGEILRSPFS